MQHRPHLTRGAARNVQKRDQLSRRTTFEPLSDIIRHRQRGPPKLIPKIARLRKHPIPRKPVDFPRQINRHLPNRQILEPLVLHPRTPFFRSAHHAIATLLDGRSSLKSPVLKSQISNPVLLSRPNRPLRRRERARRPHRTRVRRRRRRRLHRRPSHSRIGAVDQNRFLNYSYTVLCVSASPRLCVKLIPSVKKCVSRPPESLPACGGLVRLWWACPPGRRGARTNPLRITVRYGKLTPPGETEAGNPGEEPIAPTGTFRSAERRAKGYPGQACPPVGGLARLWRAHQTMSKGRA